MRKFIIMLVVVTLTASACASRGPGGLDPVGAETTAPTTTTIVPDTTTSTSTTSTTQPAPATTPTTTTTVPENCTFRWDLKPAETGVLREEWDLSPLHGNKYGAVLVALRYVGFEIILPENQLVLIFKDDRFEEEIRLLWAKFGGGSSVGFMPTMIHYLDFWLGASNSEAQHPEFVVLMEFAVLDYMIEDCVYPILVYMSPSWIDDIGGMPRDELPKFEMLRRGVEHNAAIIQFLNGEVGAEVLDEPGGITWLHIPPYVVYTFPDR